MPEFVENRGQRIAKNTLMLYVRMLALLLVGLYTSRVVLASLGETDFGIYNVVGGVVAMFSIISGSLNSAISRFITFEMGKGANAELNKVYSTAVTIQLILALVVIILAEPIGLWFIDNKMTIDPSRIPAARMVLHLSLLSFAINLMSVPQMASITAHEKMSAYAWIGILDGLMRLGVAFMIVHSPIDRLVYYALLMTLTVLIVRVCYGVYCRRHFRECRYKPVYDKILVKEMFSFAGWNFVGTTAGVLRDHGGNILVNLFYSPVVNAARGVALQLNNAIQGFVTNFMVAVNPQITKSYAAGEHDYMFSLLRKSSRMSYYLLFVLALPVIFNVDYLLGLWLKDVPGHSPLFVVLFLVLALSESFSNPIITAMLSTGNIRNYQLIVGGVLLMNLPISYAFLRAGAMPEVTVMVAIALSQICLFIRVYMLHKATGFPMGRFLRRVYVSALLKVTPIALILPVALKFIALEGFVGFLISFVVTFVSAVMAVVFVGLDKGERSQVYAMFSKISGKDDKDNR